MPLLRIELKGRKELSVMYTNKKMVKKLIASTILMPALALGLYAAPVLAEVDVENNTVKVSNTNTANVTNTVESEASTGKNDADGGNGAKGGNGGDIYVGGVRCESACGEGEVDDASTGNGGAGGNGGIGGDILTGNADASAKVKNLVNLNKTSINLFCGCANLDDVEYNRIKVRNNSDATVTNTVEAEAKTGKNDAEGGNAGKGGGGGDIEVSGAGDVEGVGTGNGGNGGEGAWGGIIVTGHAYSKSKVFNSINKNVTRIR